MQCPNCGQLVPDGAVCPRCAAERGCADRKVLNAGLKGGTFGLVVGLALLTWLLAQEFDGGLGGVVLLLPLVTFTAGLLIGRHQAKRKLK
jgi:hypothetical protein